MHHANEKYLAILKVELTDLHEDIEELIQQLTAEKERGGVTNYVFMHNLALFRNELLGVHAFRRTLDQIDPDAFATLGEMVDHIKASFAQKVRAAGLAEAINVYVGRKVDKVRQYVEGGLNP